MAEYHWINFRSQDVPREPKDPWAELGEPANRWSRIWHLCGEYEVNSLCGVATYKHVPAHMGPDEDPHADYPTAMYCMKCIETLIEEIT